MWQSKTISGMLAVLVISILCALLYPDRKVSVISSSSSVEHTADVDRVETTTHIDAGNYFGPLKTSFQELTRDENSHTTQRMNERTSTENVVITTRPERNKTTFKSKKSIEVDAENDIAPTRIADTDRKKEWISGSMEELNPDGNTLSKQQTLTETILFTQIPKTNQTDVEKEDLLCYADVLKNNQEICRKKCAIGFFNLPGMLECLPWLTCENIRSQIGIGEEIDSSGTVKTVRKGTWNNYTVVVLTVKDKQYKQDFQSGLELLKSLSGTKNIVQLIGLCQESDIFVTEYHPLGNVLSFLRALHNDQQLQPYNTVNIRFNLCLDYAETISFIHNSPSGPRIMCDSSQLGKVLHQYLITSDLRLIASDLDAVPLLESDSKTVCGKRVLQGDLIAPEQQWLLEPEIFTVDKQTRYDQKADVWKIPDVCNYILGEYGDVIRYHLFDIHSQCKKPLPENRPTARQVVDVYKRVHQSLIIQ